MLVNTHMLIGEKVYKNIQDIYSINIDKNKFIYGNIKPDLVYRLSSKSHCMTDSLSFVLDEMNKLISSLESKEQYSIKLGVINHFLSDFFCSPHYYRDDYSGIIKHINYEINLHKVFRKMYQKDLFNISILKIEKYMKDNILNTINLLENDYKKNKSMENDILFALRFATLTSIYILDKSLFRNSKLAA